MPPDGAGIICMINTPEYSACFVYSACYIACFLVWICTMQILQELSQRQVRNWIIYIMIYL